MLVGLLVALVIAGLLALSFLIAAILDAPQVHVSFSSGKCVRVDDPAAEREGRRPYTCADLPEQYEAVWVR